MKAAARAGLLRRGSVPETTARRLPPRSRADAAHQATFPANNDNAAQRTGLLSGVQDVGVLGALNHLRKQTSGSGGSGSSAPDAHGRRLP